MNRLFSQNSIALQNQHSIVDSNLVELFKVQFSLTRLEIPVDLFFMLLH